MKSPRSSMIAPIVITLIVIIYYIFYFALLISVVDGIWKYLLGMIPLGLSIGMMKVCMERIKEIKEGEEDDISKY